MKLEQYAVQYTGTAGQKKAIAYLEQWLSKWRNKEWLAFVRCYRNSSTDSGQGFSLANAMQYFAQKSYQKQAFATLDLLLEAYDNGAVAKAFAEQWKADRPLIFFSQLDSKYLYRRDNSCNASACAVMANAYGYKCTDDQILDAFEARYGSSAKTTDHDRMTVVLEKDFGFKTVFRYDGSIAQLEASLKAGNVHALGILHRGTEWNPAGGHVIAAIKAEPKGIRFMDSYGSLNNGYIGAVEEGNNVLYSKQALLSRWCPVGSDGYWRLPA